jgi:protein-S-isoprenylcysteine O-methyltransferase Ste14
LNWPTPLQLNGWMWLAWLIVWLLAAVSAHQAKLIESRGRSFIHGVLMCYGIFLILHNGNHPVFGGKIYHNDPVRWTGDIITAAGLLFSIWARAHLGKYWSGKITLKVGHKLIRTGPYRLVRHPIYTGLILGAVGGAMAAESVDGFIGLAMFITSCLLKVRWEESLLLGEFGEEYAAFRREVPMLIPFLQT